MKSANMFFQRNQVDHSNQCLQVRVRSVRDIIRYNSLDLIQLPLPKRVLNEYGWSSPISNFMLRRVAARQQSVQPGWSVASLVCRRLEVALPDDSYYYISAARPLLAEHSFDLQSHFSPVLPLLHSILACYKSIP